MSNNPFELKSNFKRIANEEKTLLDDLDSASKKKKKKKKKSFTPKFSVPKTPVTKPSSSNVDKIIYPSDKSAKEAGMYTEIMKKPKKVITSGLGFDTKNIPAKNTPIKKTVVKTKPKEVTSVKRTPGSMVATKFGIDTNGNRVKLTGKEKIVGYHKLDQSALKDKNRKFVNKILPGDRVMYDDKGKKVINKKSPFDALSLF